MYKKALKDELYSVMIKAHSTKFYFLFKKGDSDETIWLIFELIDLPSEQIRKKIKKSEYYEPVDFKFYW